MANIRSDINLFWVLFSVDSVRIRRQYGVYLEPSVQRSGTNTGGPQWYVHYCNALDTNCTEELNSTICCLKLDLFLRQL